MAHKASIHSYVYTYTVLLEPDEQGGYVVTCPALPGLVGHGDTLEEARAMAADAIEYYLESLQMDGAPVPPSEHPLQGVRRETVTISLARV
jgi:predicted RNase H-like HicB family nuclease